MGFMGFMGCSVSLWSRQFLHGGRFHPYLTFNSRVGASNPVGGGPFSPVELQGLGIFRKICRTEM